MTRARCGDISPKESSYSAITELGLKAAMCVDTHIPYIYIDTYTMWYVLLESISISVP